jgi:hypothetical protein
MCDWFRQKKQLGLMFMGPVLDDLSDHHQESKTVYTESGICHTGSLTAC